MITTVSTKAKRAQGPQIDRSESADVPALPRFGGDLGRNVSLGQLHMGRVRPNRNAGARWNVS